MVSRLFDSTLVDWVSANVLQIEKRGEFIRSLFALELPRRRGRGGGTLRSI